ncbi:MAG: Fibronectin, type III domain protein [Magnetococcales bacterium]|nr:Fibronectin, type III domain protein [Magnetococcales bacterium]HIJ85087.1 DUF1566 domain-containing protein [Magnetococcales bacterium]
MLSRKQVESAGTVIKITSILALSALFTISTTACGGGGTGGDGPPATSGLAVDGPIKGGTVKVYNADGTLCSQSTVTTDSDASFSISGASCTYPLALELSGGTDILHSAAGITVPGVTMRSVVGSSAESIANISPFSTLIYHALLKDKGNLSDAGITTSNAASSISSRASAVIDAFGFGVDTSTDGTASKDFNPITAPLCSTNYATFVQASESLSETVRRTARAAGGVNTTNIEEIFKVLGKDFSDGALDGKMSLVDGTSTSVTSGISGFNADFIRAYASSNALFVLNDIFSTNGLSITGQDVSQISAPSAVKTAASETCTCTVASYDDVKPSSAVITQWSNTKKAALSLLGQSSLADLGISSDLTTSQSISSRGSKTVSSTYASSAADSSKVSTYSANITSPPANITSPGASGLAVDGPVKGGRVDVYSAGGTKCSTASVTTNADASFTIDGGACTYPLVLELSGGTDMLHAAAGVTVPVATMRSIVRSSNETRANISPFSTLIFHALVKDKTNLTDAGLSGSNVTSSMDTKAATIISNFGFGVDVNTDGSANSSFNPVTAVLGNSNIATFVQASEALSETVRRTAKAAGGVNTANITAVLKTLGQDLSDDTLDGNMTKADGTSTTVTSGISGFDTTFVRAYIRANALFVLNEVFSTTGLDITDQNGSKVSALSALKTAVSSVNTSATTSYDSVKPSSPVVTQWSDAKKTALILLGLSTLANLGISSDLTISQSISSRGSKTVNSTYASAVADASKVSIYAANVSAAAAGIAAILTTGTVFGNAIEGPVAGASVTVYNADGSKCSAASTTTSSDAKFSLSIGTCTPPLALELSGGTDVVHSAMGVTVPQTNMRSIVAATSQTVVNISPFSTLIYHALINGAASLSAAGITTSNADSKISAKVVSVIRSFGFGVDSLTDGSTASSFNPITTSLGPTNLATFIQASEALSETIRRVAKVGGGVHSANIGMIYQYLGSDLSDNILDGYMVSSPIVSGLSGFNMDSIRVYTMSNAFFVLNEIFSTTGLSITDQNGSQANALSAIKTSVSAVSSSATTSFDSVKPSTVATTQWTDSRKVAVALLGVSTLADLGISSDLSTSVSIASRGAETGSVAMKANLADSSKVSTYSANVGTAKAAIVRPLVPKTGQTISYAAGDDGAIQAGVPWPSPRFTDNSNGTITDNLTGLIWLKNSNCFGAQNWTNALSSANTLANGSCGLADGSVAGNWRLPNRFELASLIDYERIFPALPAGHPFSSVQPNDFYWSSSTLASSTSNAWIAYLYRGLETKNFAKTNSYYVWPVRGGQ